MDMKKECILTKEKAGMKLQRMAFQILERNPGVSYICLAGIKENGYQLATMIKDILEKISNLKVNLIMIALPEQLDGSIWEAHTHQESCQLSIIIDDVVNSGKTMQYAILPFLKHEKGLIQTLTLVERSYKTFPVHIDYVGVSLSTTLKDHISVEFDENGITGAFIQ